jgi:hypothetical protein
MTPTTAMRGSASALVVRICRERARSDFSLKWLIFIMLGVIARVLKESDKPPQNALFLVAK